MIEPQPADIVVPLVRPYDFLAPLLAAHAAHSLDGTQAFDYFWTHGHVVKTPHSLILYGPDRRRDDAWWVWWAETDPAWPRAYHWAAIAQFFHAQTSFRPFVGWARRTKGRVIENYYSTTRLARLTRFSA